jgi:hypothetical protein
MISWVGGSQAAWVKIPRTGEFTHPIRHSGLNIVLGKLMIIRRKRPQKILGWVWHVPCIIEGNSKSSSTYSIPGDEAQLVTSPSAGSPGSPDPGLLSFQEALLNLVSSHEQAIPPQ